MDLGHDVLPVERALGVHWNVEHDEFVFKIQVKDKPLTRRGLLSIVSSIYDPLSFTAPFRIINTTFGTERRDSGCQVGPHVP